MSTICIALLCSSIPVQFNVVLFKEYTNNVMTPVRTKKYERKIRIKRGHRVEVEYAISLTV